jgi:hypothetical protein
MEEEEKDEDDYDEVVFSAVGSNVVSMLILSTKYSNPHTKLEYSLGHYVIECHS